MRFETDLLLVDERNTGIEVPPEVVEYRSTIAPMGGKYLIPFSSDKRTATGLRGGDHIVVDLELDTAPRIVEPPADLAAALDATPGARAAWDRLAPSHKKAHVTAIEGAKAAETRQRRVAKAIEALTS